MPDERYPRDLPPGMVDLAEALTDEEELREDDLLRFDKDGNLISEPAWRRKSDPTKGE